MTNYNLQYFSANSDQLDFVDLKMKFSPHSILRNEKQYRIESNEREVT